MTWLGLDIGSSTAKAALFDEAFGAIATASRRVPMRRPAPGRVEIDGEAVWHAVVAIVREVLAEADASGPGARPVAGIGVSAAMVGAVLLDARGELLRPIVNWEDSRAQGLIEAMEREAPGVLSRLFAVSGCVLQQGCTLPLVRALRDEEPDVMARAAHVVSLKDFVRARLTGRIAIDRTEAAVAPGSAAARSHDEALFDLFGIGDLRHLFPGPREPEARAGGLAPAAARTLGLPPDTPVAIGAGDVPSTILGAGTARAGASTVILGTTAMVGVTHDAPVFTPPDLGLLFTLPGQRWFRALVNVAGTLNLDWALATLVPDLGSGAAAYDEAERLARGAPIGANGVAYAPYLSESGIIAPLHDPDARAGFAGLSPRHTRADMLRAVYEGVVFSLADLLTLLDAPTGPLTLVGGGARSAFWSQMLADATGRDVRVPQGEEFGARGAALLGAIAAGGRPDIETAAASEPPKAKTYAPVGPAHAAYIEAMAQWRARVSRFRRASDG